MTNSELPDNISHSGQGDIVLGNKIERQINQGAGSTYIENQTLHHGAPEAPPPPRKDIILFLSASARAADPSQEGYKRLDVEGEFNAIRAQLQQGKERDRFDLRQEMGVRIEDWVRAMTQRPRIVHFAGHGGHGGLEIIGDDGRHAELVGPQALKRIFKNTDRAIEVVLLNACYSAAQSEAISRHGIYCIGFNDTLNDRAAIAFARVLYVGIGEGQSFEDSFNGAMAALETYSPRSAAIVEVWKDGIQLVL
jgi:hypothetical protein